MARGRKRSGGQRRQQSRMRAAAKACKGKRGSAFKSCMRSKLKGR